MKNAYVHLTLAQKIQLQEKHCKDVLKMLHFTSHVMQTFILIYVTLVHYINKCFTDFFFF